MSSSSVSFPHIPHIEDPVTSQEVKEYPKQTQYKHPTPPPQLDETLSNVAIILNLPQVPKSKFDKLQTFLTKLLVKKTAVKDKANIVDIYMPFGEDGKKTKGIAFVEFASTPIAKSVIQTLNNYAFDKKHTLTLRPYNDLQKYAVVDEAKYSTDFPEFQEKPQLKNWLKNLFDDQFAIKVKDRVDIMWNDLAKEGDRVHSRQKWTDGHIGWSPNGSYLITEHEQGFALWGGDDFAKQARFKHLHPEIIEFSPNESYVVTVNDAKKDNVIVWDVRLEAPSTKFTIPHEESNGLPLIRWSPDEKYFARQKKGSSEIKVYSTQTFLLNKKRLTIPNLQDFHFCPSMVNGTAIIGYWTLDRETGNASIGLMNFPKGTILGRPISIVGVKRVQMLWHKSGSYLAMKVDREKKVRSGTTFVRVDATDIFVFRTGAKDFPVDHLEIKEEVVDFSWEPQGNILGVITKHEADSNGISIKNDITLYTFGDKVKSDMVLEETDVDKILWSPKGRHAVLIFTESKTTQPLLFWDMHQQEQIGQGEHYKMSNAFWDPTGRYLCTIVSSHHVVDGDHGFTMWLFNGRVQYKRRLDGFQDFKWRPRPPTILTKKQIEKVKRGLPSKTKQYLEEEQEKAKQEMGEQMSDLVQLWRDYIIWKQELEDQYNEEKDERIELVGYDQDADDQWVEASSHVV